MGVKGILKIKTSGKHHELELSGDIERKFNDTEIEIDELKNMRAYKASRITLGELDAAGESYNQIEQQKLIDLVNALLKTNNERDGV